VEAISDLPCLRCAPTRGVRIKASAITADNLDFGMPLEPLRRGSSRAIGQKIDDLTTFQIHDDGPVVHAFPPSPLIDAGDTRHGAISLNSGTILHTPQDRAIAHGHAEPGHQSLGWSTTRGVAEQADDLGQAGRPSCERRCKLRNSRSEDPTVTLIVPAAPTRHPCLYRYWRPLSGKIPKRS
jgi:hypothetical protein